MDSVTNHTIAEGVVLSIQGEITSIEEDVDWNDSVTIVAGGRRITVKVEQQLDYEHAEAIRENHRFNEHRFRYFDVNSREEVEYYLPNRYRVTVHKDQYARKVTLSFMHNDQDPDDFDWRTLYYVAPLDEFDLIISWLEGLGYTRVYIPEWEIPAFFEYEHLAEKDKWRGYPKLEKPDIFMDVWERINKSFLVSVKQSFKSLDPIIDIPFEMGEWDATDKKSQDRRRSREDLKQKRRESRRKRKIR